MEEKGGGGFCSESSENSNGNDNIKNEMKMHRLPWTESENL